MLLKDGYVGRIFIVHTQDRAKHVLAAPWQDDVERERYLEFIQAYCTAHNAEALCFISEAWVRYLLPLPRETEAEFQARVDAVRPRDAHDRIEVVGVMVMYRDDAGERQVVSDTMEIERRANGKPSGLKPFRLNEGTDIFGGAVAEAFPQFPPDPAEQMAALLVLNAFEAR
jgi:hypothetical protein